MNANKNKQLLEVVIECAVNAAKAFSNKNAWKVETDWLDDECYVINFSVSNQNDRSVLEFDGEKLLLELGEIASMVLNYGMTKEQMKIGGWVDYSDLNYWNEDSSDCCSDDWVVMQKEVRFDVY